MNYRQRQRCILFMFADRRVHRHMAVSQLQGDLDRPSLGIEHFYLVRALDRLTLHLLGNRGVARAGKPIDAGSHEKMRVLLLRLAEQLVDVALAIADVNAAIGIHQLRRLL